MQFVIKRNKTIDLLLFCFIYWNYALSRCFICHRNCCFKSRYRRNRFFNGNRLWMLRFLNDIYANFLHYRPRTHLQRQRGRWKLSSQQLFSPLLSSAYTFITEQGMLETSYQQLFPVTSRIDDSVSRVCSTCKPIWDTWNTYMAYSFILKQYDSCLSTCLLPFIYMILQYAVIYLVIVNEAQDILISHTTIIIQHIVSWF